MDAEKMPRNCREHPKTEEEEEHFLNKDGDGLKSAAKQLRNPLKDKKERSLVIENIKIWTETVCQCGAHNHINRVITAVTGPQGCIGRIEE